MLKSTPKSRHNYTASDAAVKFYDHNQSSPELKNSRFIERQSNEIDYVVNNMMELKDLNRLTTVHKQSDSFNVDGADGLNLSSKTPPGSSNRLDSVSSVKGISKALRTSISGIRDNKKLHILGTSGTTFNDSNNLYSSSKKFYQIG